MNPDGTCTLQGYFDNPESWEIGGVLDNPKVKALDRADFGYFKKEFNTYNECRAWVISELFSRRKKLGVLIDIWMKRR